MALEKRKWALLAYVAGDNNLSRAGRADIEELAQAGVNNLVHAAAEFDARSDDFEGSIRYEITTEEEDPKDAARLRGFAKIIEHRDEKDSGDPKTFREFLDWGLDRYPADNVLVVVWGHGHGFKDFTKSVADDFQSNSALDMRELKLALAGALQARNMEKLSVLGFDACLMSMLEVAFELKDLTRFIVGSQQTERAEGWPYDQVLGAMKQAPAPDVLGGQIVKAYLKFYADHGLLNGTQSVIDTSRVDGAMHALADFGSALSQELSTDPDGFRRTIQQTRIVVQSFDASDYVDLMDLSHRFSQIDRIKSAADALGEAVIACIGGRGSTADLQNANGLSTWFPLSKTLYLTFRPQYASLTCNRKFSGWQQFLDRFLVS